MRNLLFIKILILFSCSCNPVTHSSEKKLETSAHGELKNTPFFDLKLFFENEINTSLKEKHKINKTIVVNGKTERKQLELKNWQEELSPFINADINRPAWYDKYLKKEQNLPDGSVQKEYYALADILKTRHLIVNELKNQTSITILNQERTATTDNTTLLRYETHKGYSIKTTQRLLNSIDTIIIDVLFVNK